MAKVACPAANKDLRLGLGCASELSYDKDFLSSGLEQGPLNWLQPCWGKLWIRAAGGAAEAALGLGRRRIRG